MLVPYAAGNHTMPTRLPLFILLAATAVATAAPASAQGAEAAAPTADVAPTRWSRFATAGFGMAANGPTGRALLGTEARLGRQLSLGLAARLAAARGPYPVDGTEADSDLYAEFGLSLRPSWRVGDRTQVAASAGYGLAAVVVRDGEGHAANDFGFTVPLEAEASVRLWRTLGATAGVSRSLPLKSFRTESTALTAPEGYALDHWTATVGVRVGRW